MKDLIKALADLDQCRKEKNVMMAERDRALSEVKCLKKEVAQLKDKLDTNTNPEK